MPKSHGEVANDPTLGNRIPLFAGMRYYTGGTPNYAHAAAMMDIRKGQAVSQRSNKILRRGFAGWRRVLRKETQCELELKLAELLLSQQQRAASPVSTIARTEAMVPATGDWMNFVAGSSSEDEDVTELPPQRRLGACLPRTGSYHRLDRHERQTDAKSGYVQRLKNEKVVTSPARRKVETSTDRRKVETSNDRRPCQRNLEARAKPHHSSLHVSRRDSHDFQDCVTLLHDMRLQRPKTAGVNNHVSGCDSGRVMRSAFRSRQGEQNPAVDEEGIFAWVMPPS